jgi:transcriptional regulator with XRE-family HTH domain
MNHLDESAPAVVALLLDDLAPPRLGTLLRAARKQSGATRHEVASRIGTSAGELRRYERGDAPVPAHLIAALAECYGEDLTAQLATRAPIRVEEHRLTVGDAQRSLASEDDDELLAQYVGIVASLRNAQAGEPIGLRADDLVALSVAIGQDSAHVEARIVELLGCTRSEARSLHSEMLRRKLVLPVAGLIAGIALVAGTGLAQASPGSGAPQALHAPHVSQAVHAPTVDATGQVAAAYIAAGHIAAGHAVTEVVDSPPTTVVVKTYADADAPAPAPAPTTTPDTTPMSIPANETVTIIAP